jgi:hypothetical protein
MAMVGSTIVVVTALAVPIVIAFVTVIGGIWYRVRKMEHAERMAALQQGRTLPKDEPWLTPVKVVLLMTTVTPTAIFGILAVALAKGLSNGLIPAAILLGLGCIVGGVRLGMRLPAFRTAPVQCPSAEPTVNHKQASTAKPNLSPECLDFAGRN